MKATGIVRRIDDLGRVVIPKEIRKTLRIKEGTPLEIFTDREGQIILKKYSPIGELTSFAELEGKEISAELDEIIAGREGKFIDGNGREKMSLVSGGEDSFCGKMIQPILCASDAIGSVILLGKNEKTVLGEKERALVRTAASFLGRQMEQ